MKKMYFNVFDGVNVNRVTFENLIEMIQNNKNTFTISPIEYKGRIKLAPSKKNWIIKTNVKANSCMVNQKRIVAIAKNYKRRIFSNIAECSKMLNIDNSNISKVLKGKRHTANGYKFEYVS